MYGIEFGISPTVLRQSRAPLENNRLDGVEERLEFCLERLTGRLRCEQKREAPKASLFLPLRHPTLINARTHQYHTYYSTTTLRTKW